MKAYIYGIGQQKGAVMAELLVALALLGLIAPVFLGALNTGSKATQVIEQQSAAVNLARAELETVESADFPVADYQSTRGEYVVSVNTDPDPPAVSMKQNITVTVSQAGKLLAQLSGLKVAR
jgi:type II secretory pathway pseudopilin PulG